MARTWPSMSRRATPQSASTKNLASKPRNWLWTFTKSFFRSTRLTARTLSFFVSPGRAICICVDSRAPNISFPPARVRVGPNCRLRFAISSLPQLGLQWRRFTWRTSALERLFDAFELGLNYTTATSLRKENRARSSVVPACGFNKHRIGDRASDFSLWWFAASFVRFEIEEIFKNA